MQLASEVVFAVEVQLGAPLEVGQAPDGFRRVIPIVGGTVSDGLDGVVLPGGADWNVVRADGSTDLCARYELRLAGGAVVSVTNVAALAPGAEPPFLTSPSFEVGSGGPTWLRTGVFVGLLTPAPDGSAVTVQVFRLAAAG